MPGAPDEPRPQGMHVSRLHRLCTLAVTFVLAFALAGEARGGHAKGDRLLAPASFCTGTSINVMACLVQYAREHVGLPPLRESGTLDRAGQLKVDADIRCQQFTHTPCSQRFEAAFAAAGYPLGTSLSVGENLAWGQGSGGSPREVMRAWLASAEHRSNLLSAHWKTLGIASHSGAYFLGNRDVTVWATEFGSR
jgi:hypothetical protein